MSTREGAARAGVVVVSGSLATDRGGRPATELRQAVEGLLAEGAATIVLDLSNVRTLCAAGLGEIGLAFTTVRRRGARLEIYRPNERVQRLFRISRVDTVIPTRLTLEAEPMTTLATPTKATMAKVRESEVVDWHPYVGA